MKHTSAYFICVFFLIINVKCIAQQTWDDSLSSLAYRLGEQLNKKFPNKNIIVPDFIDGTDKTSKLGKYAATVLRAELVKSLPSRIIDRRLTSELAEEVDLQNHKLVRMEFNNGDKKFEHIDYFLIGTMTSFRDYIDITIEVVDFRKGVTIAAERGKLPLATDNSNKNEGVENSPDIIMPDKIETTNQSAIDYVMQAKISDIRQGECKREYYNDILYSGQICFENQTGEDLIFYSKDFNPGERLDDFKMALANGRRNCSRFIVANFDNLTRKVNENTSRQVIFVFYTTDNKRTAEQSYVIDACKVKSIVLTKDNLMLLKP
jgi:hypothetical protein